jgi:hypothetical protein
MNEIIEAPTNQIDRHKAFRRYVAQCEDVIRGAAPLASLAVRKCGDCTMCCKAPAISDDQIGPEEAHLLTPKPSGEKCRHCTDTGCSIYQKRPEICRGYLCLWLVGIAENPPMTAGVCWTMQPDLMTGRIMVVGHGMDAAEIMKDLDNREDIRSFLTLGEGLTPSAVVLRTPTEVVRFDNTGLPNMMADIDPYDPMKVEVLAHTQRRAEWKP